MGTLYLRILSFYVDDKFLYSVCSTYINAENEENFCFLSEIDLRHTANVALSNLQT